MKPSAHALAILLMAFLLRPLGAAGAVDDLFKSFGSARPATEFLPPEQAFRVEAQRRDDTSAVVRFSPAPGYYLYRDKLAFRLEEASGSQGVDAALPAAEPKLDPIFGRTQVYHEPFEAVLRLQSHGTARPTLAVDYQGCADQGLCYAPMTKTFTLDSLGAVLPTASASDARSSAVAEDSRIAAALRDGGLWASLAAFFGFGLLLALTPCVFPMIPILSGIIAGHEHAKLSHSRGFMLALAYVLGMALTYAVAGIAAGLSGTMLSAVLQTPWVLATFAAVFVLLACSMFGLFELQLPTFLQSRLAAEANRLHGGHFAGVFGMGAVSALIVGPCVAPPLAGALLYISQTREALQGGAALFFMGLGMGMPLLLIGATGGAVLPRSGPWMESVKQVFGVVMLAVAIWLVTPLLPAVVVMLSWAALCICSAIFLHAIDPLPHGASGLRKLAKGVGVIVLLLGVALLIGALSGSRDPLQPLSGLRATAAPAAPALDFQRVRNLGELETRLANARGKPVMLDFYADWCVACKEMDRFTFSDPRVRAALDDFVLLQADVTANTADDRALLQRFSLFGPPGYIFFSATGDELSALRVTGFKPADAFLAVLEQIDRR